MSSPTIRRMFCADMPDETEFAADVEEEGMSIESIVRREVERSEIEALVKKEVQEELLQANPPDPSIEITSFHQITLFYWLPVDGHEKPWKIRIGFFVASYLLVIFQIMVTAGIYALSVRPSCYVSDSCHGGQWCKRDLHLCQPCLKKIEEFCEAEDEAAFVEKYSKHRFTAEDYTTACSACYRGEDDEAEEFTTEMKVVGENLKIMQFYDWIALLVTTVIVAAALAEELNDVWITRFLIRELKPRSTYGRLAGFLRLLLVLRLHVLLPMFFSALPNITSYLGGDALNVCLNAVAVIFIADLDEYVVNFVPGDLKDEVVDSSREVFGDLMADEKSSLNILKMTNLFALPFGVIISTLLGAFSKPSRIQTGAGVVGFGLPLISQIVVAVNRQMKAKGGADANGPPHPCQAICSIILEFFLGVAINVLIFYGAHWQASMSNAGVLVVYDDDGMQARI